MVGRRWVSWVLALFLSAPALSGCAGGGGDAGGGRTRAAGTEVRQLLARRASAVLHHDQAAYTRTGSGTPYANLGGIPLASWSYRLTSLRTTGDRATAQVQLRYRLEAYDSGEATAERAVGLARDSAGHWTVTSEGPARGASRQLWDQGAVEAVHGTHTLVLGTGQDEAALRGYARTVDRAVPAVTRAWGSGRPQRVVLLVPDSLRSMAALLGAPASRYRDIAAVTVGHTGRSGPVPADRIVVNPEAYGALSAVGGQVVLTHETTHAATRSVTTPTTPMWLSEGYADWVGYRGTGLSPAEAAPELRRAVEAGDVPEDLPTDADFRFDGDPARLARAYEGGWLACRFIAEEWGAAKLNRFYRRVGTGGETDQASAVGAALREVLGTTPDDFTGRWRDYLEDQLGSTAGS